MYVSKVGYPFCEHLLVRRRGRIMYYLVEFKTMNKHKQLFVQINQIKFDHHSTLMQDNVTSTEYRGWLMRIHTCVKEKGGYFEHKLWHFNSSVTQ